MKTIICHAVENNCPRNSILFEDCQSAAEHINNLMSSNGWIDAENAERQISECDDSIKKHLSVYQYEVEIDE